MTHPRVGSLSALFLIVLEGAARAQAPAADPGRARIPVVRRVPTDFATIQGAIDAARDGDVVLVRQGDYSEHLDFRGKALEVVSQDGATRSILAPTTAGAVVRFHHGEGPDSRLIGFTIRGGTTDPTSSAGGVSCIDPDTGRVSSPTLSDCIIEHNSASQDYGGLGPGGVSGNAILERCTVRDNHSSNPTTAGGAQGRLTLIQCVIEENVGCGAGGLWLEPGAHVLDSVIRGNRAETCNAGGAPLDIAGGGIRTPGTGVVIEGSLLFDNVVAGGPDGGGFGGCYAESRGGALSGDALLERCTIVGNGWDTCGTIGGIEGNPELVDCILYANEDPASYYAGQLGMRYSDVQGGAAGAGSFDLFPELVDPGTGDLRLGPSSPCIDRGNPQSRADADGTRADLGALYHPQGGAPLGVVWREEAPLVSGDQDPLFGISVAAAGDTLLVGSSVVGEPRGSVRVLRRQSGAWTETQRLESGVPDDEFGWSVAMEGDIAAIGAIGYLGSPEGTVHVYERDSPAAPFEASAHLVGGRLAFGASLALDGDMLVVGDQDREFLAPGRAYVYQRLARGHWRQVASLSPPETDTWLYPQFGAAVDIDGDTLVVGAPMYGDADTYFGAVYVYERAGASPWSWVLARTLYPSGPVPGGQFGRSLSLEDDTLLVGSRYAPTVFERSGPGLPWREAQVFTPSGGPPEYGSNVLLRGNRAWITMPATLNTTQPTALWEFSRANAGAPWYEVARVALPAGAFMSYRANALAFTEDSLFLGASRVGGEPAVRRLTRGPQVNSIQRDQAADEETLVIRGERLDEVSALQIGGVAEPLVSRTEGELVIRPARRAPGFADLTLSSAGGELTLPERFESLPTLRADATGAGGTLAVALENGGPGAFVLLYSFGLRAQPFVLRNPPTWFGLELQFQPGRNPILALDSFPSSGRAELEFVLPDDPALVGLPLHLQAWCRRGLLGPLRNSFSNTASTSF